jgi:glucan biosynthesis protein C
MTTRNAGLDNLKVFLILLVVLHHAGQPYGPTGGAWPIFHAERFRLLGPFFHVNASFFMGLFFLISAYFLPASFDRKGARRFLAERFRRLGIPALLFGFGLVPLVRHFDEGKPWPDSFLPFEWAHLWFLAHLMVYALLYAGFRALTGPRRREAERPFPGHGRIALYVILLAAVDLVVRHWWPIDRWGRWIVTAEVAHLPQYASLFLFGLAAANQRWLDRIPEDIGRTWLRIGVAAVVLRFAYSIVHIPFLGGGGLWVDIVWNLWEAIECAGLCVGLIHLFQTRCNEAGALLRFLGRHAYAVYVLHVPVLVALQKAMEATSFGPLTLTLMTAAMAIPICLALAELITRGVALATARR